MGDDLGPSPFELLLSALGACTSMTLLIHARRKGWPLRDVQVELTHDRGHATDCATCEEDDTRIEVIRRHVVLVGPLLPEQRVRLQENATRCPVHMTLTAPPRIEDTFSAENT